MEHVVIYEVAGIVNNVPVALAGRGTLTKDSLAVEQGADRDVLHWDAALVAPFCLDALLAIGAGAAPLPEPGLSEPVRSWTMLFDENGRETGRAVCSGSLALEDGALRLRAQFLEAAFRMELGERIRRIGVPYPVGVLPAGDVRAVLNERLVLRDRPRERLLGLDDDLPGCLREGVRATSVLSARGRDREDG